jgi:non-homologous end joining protein Ku
MWLDQKRWIVERMGETTLKLVLWERTERLSLVLINVLTKIYSVTESSSLDLEILDKKDHAYVIRMQNTVKEVELCEI